eukprot:CAMPEP_0172298316 /NCGR_PEP_ID=MMETSP1058-20130122/1032_1 /TAXON_ID=83371 /ORGANISM="Detonula confervacea, Strain CCMP 353" /LENGTH=292 /DNA_ID=CAMNT_0013007583 /DNA_START=33 /DNA_END=911 /DNA_ORIENTATION=-
MGFPSNSRPHAHRHRINILALSIVLYASGITAPIQVEGAFIASINSQRLPSSSSFVRQTSPSASRALPRAMSTDENNEKKEDDVLPPAGSFFNAVPPPKEESSDDNKDGAIENTTLESSDTLGNNGMEMFDQIIQETTLSRSSSGKGFSKLTSTTDHVTSSVIQTTDEKKSFVGIGKPLNDVQNPEYDENGYTLYADETTGEKKRVFEALVEYPSVFKIKIVGKDDENETFAPEMVRVVAESCGVDASMVKHTKRMNGKWTSVTVHAPVKNADMLYNLYKDVDKDPRVKFKF